MLLADYKSGDIFELWNRREAPDYYVLVGEGVDSYQFVRTDDRGQFLELVSPADLCLDDATKFVYRYACPGHFNMTALNKFFKPESPGWAKVYSKVKPPVLNEGYLIKLKHGQELFGATYGFVLYTGEFNNHPEILWLKEPEKGSDGSFTNFQYTDNINSILSRIEYIADTLNMTEVWEVITERDTSKIIWRA